MAKQFPIEFRGTLWKGGTNEAITQAARRTAGFCKNRLTEASPKRTGRLSKGWDVKVKGTGLIVRNPVPYTGFVIRGTSRMKGNPFFQQVMAETTRHFTNELAEELGKKFAARITKNISMSFSFESLSGKPLNRSE